MECLRCKEEMFNAKLCGDAYGTGLFLRSKKKGMFEMAKDSTVSCYVCPECGYVELKADEPKKIRVN
ncbi:MAG: hypothetical protein IJ326_13060 [Lachnospiraceae bacterium]|nr:hypothetical protein [Lachnospiraceae bacterium]